MPDRSRWDLDLETPSILSDFPENEFELHQEFLFRHIDFLIDTLTAEHYNTNLQRPSGCPNATPELQSHRRRKGESISCRYEELPRTETSDSCLCNDSLKGSDDPLDTVAAVSIAQSGQTPSQRYFDAEYRGIISNLRENEGTWDEIGKYTRSELANSLAEATNRKGISESRVQRLYDLLKDVEELHYTEGITLSGIGGIQYENFVNTLEGLTGIERSDAWWLLLVAYDKPVWPVGELVDTMLVTLGLLHPQQVDDRRGRRKILEDRLTERQIPQLHRAIAAHAVKADTDTCGESCETQKFFLTHRLRKQKERDSDQPVLVDLFSGAGGLSLGFSRDGWNIELAIDNDQDATDTFRLNHPEVPHRKIIHEDIQDNADEMLDKTDQNPDIVVGGPPCQSLSQAGYRSRLAKDEEYSILEDDRTELYEEYVEVVRSLRPKVIVMENVEGMVNRVDETEIRVGDLVLEAINSIGSTGPGYVSDYRLIDASEYGIPQERERVFFLGIREDLTDSESNKTIENLFETLSENSPQIEPDLKQALAGLPHLRRGEGGNVVPEKIRGPRSGYVTENKLDEGTNLSFNHQGREHPLEKDRTLFDQALDPGDTSWDIKYASDGEYADLIEYDVGSEDNPRFKDKYRMLKWDKPAPTVVAHLAKDANNFVIPDFYEYVGSGNKDPDNRRNRGITPREAARLQSFPDDYIFLGAFTDWFRQIGNAVPPILGQQIASTLSKYIDGGTSIKSEAQPAAKVSTDD